MVSNRKIAKEFINFIINLKQYARTQIHYEYNPAITEQQFRTLMHLKRLGKCTLKELSKNIHISNSSVCIMLNKLWDEGYIIRETDPKDRRNTFYSLSDIGNKFLDDEIEKKLTFLERKIDSLPEDKKEKLSNCLNELMQILNEMK